MNKAFMSPNLRFEALTLRCKMFDNHFMQYRENKKDEVISLILSVSLFI